MADSRISDLTAAGTLAGTEQVPIVQSSATVRTTLRDINAIMSGPGYVAGDRHGPTAVALSTRTVASGLLYVVPYFVRNSQAFDRILCEISTAGTGSTVVRMGIWNHNTATGKPGTLIVDGGTASGTAPAEVSVTISQTLSPGWVWLGVVGQTVTGSPVVRGLTNGLLNPGPIIGNSVISSASIPICAYSISGITGALATLVGATFTITTIGPFLQLRAA